MMPIVGRRGGGGACGFGWRAGRKLNDRVRSAVVLGEVAAVGRPGLEQLEDVRRGAGERDELRLPVFVGYREVALRLQSGDSLEDRRALADVRDVARTDREVNDASGAEVLA